jgi:lipopolysaccharide export system protein LptA
LFFLFIILFFCVWISPADSLASKQLLKNFKIISADRLEVKEKNSLLIGNVEIEVQNFNIKAPNVLIETKKDKSKLVKFENGVDLKSKEIFLNCQNMDVDLEKSIMNCTSLEDSSVIFKKDDIEINSKNLELKFTKEKIEFVKFFEDTELKKEEMEISAENILYFPELKLIKLIGSVWMNYISNEEEDLREINLYADLVHYEEAKGLISAYSTSLDHSTFKIIPVVLFSSDFFSEARMISLELQDGEVQTAILQGEAFARFKDKAMQGDELIMNIPQKELNARAGRPKTLIYSENSID